ncbi:hypothetical protein AcV5_007835 [Taiwanofungus camphoratus]|nr:hypothetical protein AcV5_007835 [Antrodia cinnamomea]KAI0947145.1 hypothetical protein AcV7_009646 [Antrodia cinnamomea]
MSEFCDANGLAEESYEFLEGGLSEPWDVGTFGSRPYHFIQSSWNVEHEVTVEDPQGEHSLEDFEYLAYLSGREGDSLQQPIGHSVQQSEMRPVAGPASVDMLDHGSADYHHSFDDGQAFVNFGITHSEYPLASIHPQLADPRQLSLESTLAGAIIDSRQGVLPQSLIGDVSQRGPPYSLDAGRFEEIPQAPYKAKGAFSAMDDVSYHHIVRLCDVKSSSLSGLDVIAFPDLEALDGRDNKISIRLLWPKEDQNYVEFWQQVRYKKNDTLAQWARKVADMVEGCFKEHQSSRYDGPWGIGAPGGVQFEELYLGGLKHVAKKSIQPVLLRQRD